MASVVAIHRVTRRDEPAVAADEANFLADFCGRVIEGGIVRPGDPVIAVE